MYECSFIQQQDVYVEHRYMSLVLKYKMTWSLVKETWPTDENSRMVEFTYGNYNAMQSIST